MAEENSVCDNSQSPESEDIRLLLAQHPILSDYVHNLERECLDAQASIFEEANKKIQAALKSEDQAKKIMIERENENEMLKFEVQALKHMIDKLNGPSRKQSFLDVPFNESPRRSRKNSFSTGLDKIACFAYPSPPEPTKLHPNFFQKRVSAGNITDFDRKMSPIISLYPPNYRDMSMFAEQLRTDSQNREELLNRLLNTHCTLPEDQPLDVFKEFSDWVESGCDLSLISCIAMFTENYSLVRQQPSNIFVEEDQSDDDKSSVSSSISDVDNQEIKVQAVYDLSTGVFSRPQDASSAYSSMTRHVSPMVGMAYLHRIFQEDIIPTWKFKNHQLTLELMHALADQLIEITPCEANATTCPLVTSYTCNYQLSITGERQHQDSIHIKPSQQYFISKLARDRIASVINLYVSLSQVKTMLGGKSSGAAMPELAYEAQLRRNFHFLQKRRVSVNLTRLGFGLPESD